MKKLTSILLTIAMLMSTVAFAAETESYSQSFWDVPKEHWAFGEIAELVNRGIIEGYDNGSFDPYGAVSRAEWAKMLFTAGNVPEAKYIHLALENSGDMSKRHWAALYMVSVKDYLAPEMKNEATMYRPDDAATREEVAVSLAKFKGYASSDVSIIQQFSDSKDIGQPAYIAGAVKEGIVNGYDDGSFKPRNPVTRAEAAALLCRALKLGQ
ncbi:MAG: S-layer homology domain-containing protein [Clostridiales bacterium]|nr:S-layer homology domain-containing protein [Clostridiales bacterium]